MSVAIVTGGASGIGLAITKMLVSRGYKVTIADWNETTGREASAALGDNTIFIRCNVSRWDNQVKSGPSLTAVLDKIEKPDTSKIEIDVNGTLYTLRLAIFYLRQNGKQGGKIVATSSQTGIYSFPMMPTHSACKAAIIAMCRSIAPTLSNENILVNSLCPGLTLTTTTKPVLEFFPKSLLTPMENHVKVFEQFLDTDLWGATIESDVAGSYNRKRPEPWAPENQGWVYTQEDPKNLGYGTDTESEK